MTSASDSAGGLLDELAGGRTGQTTPATLEDRAERLLAEVQAMLEEQLREILHHPRFQALEGSWRGLHWLVTHSETDEAAKIKVASVSKEELQNDFDRHEYLDDSWLFQRLFHEGVGATAGEIEPVLVLVGDYEFSHQPQDVELLSHIASVAESSFSLVASAASPRLFNVEKWQDSGRLRDLGLAQEGPDHIKWRAFRDDPLSRHVVLTAPRVLARLPYAADSTRSEDLSFDELPPGGKADGALCWMSSAYALAQTILRSFQEDRWCAAVHGAAYGKVEGLPCRGKDGCLETRLPERRETELARLGIVPLSAASSSDTPAFLTAGTLRRPQRYTMAEGDADAIVAASYPFVLSTARIMQGLLINAARLVRSNPAEVENLLNEWLRPLVASPEAAAGPAVPEEPFLEAEVNVCEVPDQPGAQQVIAKLKPALPYAKLTAPVYLAAVIP